MLLEEGAFDEMTGHTALMRRMEQNSGKRMSKITNGVNCRYCGVGLTNGVHSVSTWGRQRNAEVP